MSTVIDRPPTRIPHIGDRDAGHRHQGAHPEAGPSWFWALVESLAYAGAAFDPAAALAAQRLARIRDQELRQGRR